MYARLNNEQLHRKLISELSDSWVVAQWATWVRLHGRTSQAAGGFYVPVLHTHPVPEMTYIVENCEAQKIIVHKSLEEKGRQLAEKTGYADSSSVTSGLT